MESIDIRNKKDRNLLRAKMIKQLLDGSPDPANYRVVNTLLDSISAEMGPGSSNQVELNNMLKQYADILKTEGIGYTMDPRCKE